MPEQVRATRTRVPTSDEEAHQVWFSEQERDPTKNLEAVARQIIQLVTALYTVVFGILALAADPVPAYLARTSIRLLGATVVLGYLVALLAALVVVVPSAYRYAPASHTQRKQVFAALMQRKSLALRAALIAFGIASAAFAALFVVVMFGW